MEGQDGRDELDRFFGLQVGETGTSRMAITFPDPDGGNYNYQVMFGESLHGNPVGGQRVVVNRDQSEDGLSTWDVSGLIGGVSIAYVVKSTSKGKAQIVDEGLCALEVDLRIVCVNGDCPVP